MVWCAARQVLFFFATDNSFCFVLGLSPALDAAVQEFACTAARAEDLEADADAWACVARALYNTATPGYQTDPDLGQGGTYGELTPLGLLRLVETIPALLPRGLDDEGLFDLGAGSGKVLFQAALHWAPRTAVGVELSATRCRLAGNALEDLRHRLEGSTAAREALARVRVFCEDALQTDLQGASVVLTNSLCFPKAVLGSLGRLLAELPAGTLVLSSASLPGCHRGLSLLRLVTLENTGSAPPLYHVYVSTPQLPTPYSEKPMAWRFDFANETAEQFICGQARTLVEEGLATDVTVLWSFGEATMHAVARVFGSNLAMVKRLLTALAGADREISLVALEKSLMNRLRGDLGSPVACFVAELRDAIEDTHLRELREAIPYIARLRDDAGDSVLHLAAATGDEALVRSLLDAQIPVDVRGGGGAGGETPLFASAKTVRGGTAALELLLARRAEVSVRNDRGATAMHSAAFSGRVPALRCLLDSGGEATAQDNVGQTPAHRAALGGEAAALAMLAATRADLCAKDARGATALHTAAGKARASAVGALLEANVGCSLARDLQGNLPLHRAAAARGGGPSVHRLLRFSGGALLRNLEGETALHVAASHGHLAAIDELLEWDPGVVSSSPAS